MCTRKLPEDITTSTFVTTTLFEDIRQPILIQHILSQDGRTSLPFVYSPGPVLTLHNALKYVGLCHYITDSQSYSRTEKSPPHLLRRLKSPAFLPIPLQLAVPPR